jgi:AcrR family transcriptional regulator
MELLIKEYKKKMNPGDKVTVNQCATMCKLIDSFVELLDRKDMTVDKMPVRDVAVRAGFSRTTFYVHFRDVYDVMQTLEEMCLYHTDLNAKVYCLLFQNKLCDRDTARIYKMLDHYGKYIRVLLEKDPTFMPRYKEKFISVMTHGKDVRRSGDIEQIYHSVICASVMIESYIFWLEHQDIMPYGTIIETSHRVAANTVYYKDSKPAAGQYRNENRRTSFLAWA